MSPSLDVLIPRLKQSEGWRSHVYLDTTGHLTIGYGHNLARLLLPLGVEPELIPVNGITETIGEALLVGDVLDTLDALRKELPWYDELDEPRQQVLADMAFNMGVSKLVKGWPGFLGDVRSGRHKEAAGTMRHSLWARQVGRRVEPLAVLMESENEKES